MANSARLTVYASPYTPSLGDWDFQYCPNQGHNFSIGQDVDVVVTHGPPEGVMDKTESGQRAGSKDLFAAVARARPRLHCFGHIHEGWGSKLVTWRNVVGDTPSHFTTVDHGNSVIVENLSTLKPGKFDTSEMCEEKREKQARYSRERCCTSRHCASDERAKQSNSAARRSSLTLLFKVRTTSPTTCHGGLR